MLPPCRGNALRISPTITVCCGHHLDQHRHSSGAVPHGGLFVVDAFQFARTLLDGAVDVTSADVLAMAASTAVPQTRVARGRRRRPRRPP